MTAPRRVRRHPLTVRARLTLWFSAFLVLVCVAALAVVTWAGDQVLRQGVRDGLVEAVEGNVDDVGRGPSGGTPAVGEGFRGEVAGVHTSLVDGEGRLLYGENPVAGALADLDVAAGAAREVDVDGVAYYVYDRPLAGDGLDGLWLRGVASEEAAASQALSVAELALVALPGLVVLGVAGGWVVAGRSLRPVREISETARRIAGADDLSRRIELGEGADELHELADRFNEMFSRLEASFQAQRRFTSDASHELRTPLAVLSAQCEVALEDGDLAPGEREGWETVRRQAARMARLVDDMLAFSRIESDPGRYPFEELDLADVVGPVARDAEVLAAGRCELACDLPRGLVVRGNRELLSSVAQNLLANAVRHGSSGGHVRVRLARDGATALLEVADDGCGIAAEEQVHVFERFWRADAARSGEGTGLGLPLAREACRLHGGELRLASSAPGEGSVFVAELPLAEGAGTPGA